MSIDAQAIANALTPWFAREQRDMTWRGTRDPYAIWVSEIMLQQTRVETVERYYAPFIAAFPTVQALAEADQERVLAHWSGLGYYRRARLLHRGARHVVEALGGELPRTAPALREIPGVGPYTAGAIASIAFDAPEPLVDGNVARVLSRLHAIEEPAEQDARARRHWAEVGEILRRGQPRVLAQALMELGATVCTPVAPTCDRCPVADGCEARARRAQGRIPSPRKKVAQPQFRWIALLVRRGNETLLVKRPDEGLLAGLWCVPLIPTKAASPVRAPRKAAAQMLGVLPTFGPKSSRTVKHVFTHRIWHLHPWGCEVKEKPALESEHVWLRPGADPPGGVPSVTRKILSAGG